MKLLKSPKFHPQIIKIVENIRAARSLVLIKKDEDYYSDFDKFKDEKLTIIKENNNCSFDQHMYLL